MNSARTLSAQAAVLRTVGEPFEVIDVALQAPRDGEVLVRIEAAGVCHSDYLYATGKLIHPLPVILGHEGAGSVEAVGDGVHSVRVGDHVVPLWRSSCGRCEYCSMGRAPLCSAGRQMRATGTLLDGTSRIEIAGEPAHHFLGVSCFAQYAVVPESALLAIPSDIPMPVAAIASCSVLTGFGAVLNAGRMSAGDVVAVIGAGGVGIAAVATATLAGASRVVVVEPNANRRAFAASFGATDLIDSNEAESGQAILETLNEGVDLAIEAAGDPPAIRLATDLLRPGGTAVLVGGHVADTDGTFAARDLIVDEKTVVGSIFGSSRPAADFKRIFALYRAGRLPLERMLGGSYPLKRINDAYAELSGGRSQGRLILSLR